MPTRVVLDTNVVLSGLLSAKGPPALILDAWLQDRFILITSLYLIREVEHVLSYPRLVQRLNLTKKEQNTFLAALLARSEVTPGKLQLSGITRDPQDDALIACAVEGRADVVVSGDQDILVLGEYQGIQMVTPRRFIEMLGLVSPADGTR